MITTKPDRGLPIVSGELPTDRMSDWLDDVTDKLNAIPRSNYTATVNPSGTDDKTKGYSVGSEWLNAATGKWYKARSVAIGAAFWDILN